MKNKRIIFTQITLGLCVLISFSCEQKVPEIKKPEKTISVERAKALQQNYVNTRGTILKDTFGYEDTREFHYTLAELEEYIAYVKQEAKKEGYDDLGIRIYFAAYEPTADRKFGLSTVFLAPTGIKDQQRGTIFNLITKQSSPSNIYEIDPLNDNQGGWPPKNY